MARSAHEGGAVHQGVVKGWVLQGVGASFWQLAMNFAEPKRPKSMLHVAGTTKYRYYAGGLLNTEDGRWANDMVTFSYNNARLRSSMILQQPSGNWTNGYAWDAA